MKLKVLIAENDINDAEKIAHEMKIVLSAYECVAILVYSWNDVLERINDDNVDIVVMNYYFGCIDGYDMLKILKNKYPFISVVIMTSEGDKKIAINVTKLGADGYVSKKYGYDGIGYAILNVIIRKKTEIEVNRLADKLNEELELKRTHFKETIKNATRSLREKNTKLARIVEIGKMLSSQKVLDDLLVTIIKETTEVLEADRTSLFIYDEDKEELWSKIAEKSVMKEIRFNVHKGIAGYVARTRKILNIKDVYENELFNPEFDSKTGFHTKNMLCAPLQSNRGKLIGVMQVMNKKMESFGKDDEEIISTFASLIAVVIENAKLSEENLKKERTSIIGEMAKSIVHDLKNPMTTIKGYAQLIAIKSPELSKPANIIIDEMDRLVKMAQDLLEFAGGKDKSIELKKVNCETFFNEIFCFLRKDFEKRSIKFNYTVRFRDSIEIDSDKIRRAIFNIAGNAQDAMVEGCDFNIDVVESSDKENVIISLADTGKGMPPELKDTVFDAFVTYGKKRGTGLGMAITKKIVDAHKGTIRVDSKEGEGTKFKIILPKLQKESVLPG